MEKRISLAILALAVSVAPAAGAQDFWLGLHGGIGIPNLSGGGNPISRGYESIVTPNVGLVAEYGLTSHFSLKADLDYTGQGGQRKGVQPITQAPGQLPPVPPGQYLYGDFKNKSVLNYLELPVMAKYGWGHSGHWQVFVEGGPYFGYLLNASDKTSGTSGIYTDANGTPLSVDGYPVPAQSFDAETNVKSSLREFNWGVTAGLGAEYLIARKHALFVEVRGEYGLRTVQNDSSNGSSNTGCALFTIGYLYRFSR
jgi:hypothetical protein